MESLHTLWAAMRVRRDERRRRSLLRREILGYRTPNEQNEIQAILARYDMTVDDLLRGRWPESPPPSARPDWEDAWDEIVLDLSDVWSDGDA